MDIHVIKNGQQCGPFTEAQLQDMLHTGMVHRSDLAWHEDLPEWQPVHSVLGLKAPPPMPGPDQAQQILKSNAPAAAIDPNLASRMTRFRAYWIDCGFLFALLLPGILMGLLISEETSWMDVPAALLFIAGPITFLIVQGMMLSKQGQTVGKKYLKIRIVDERDDSNPGFVRAVLLRYILPNLLGVSMVGAVLQIVEVLFIFRADRKCIHDFLANTKVVNVQGA